jgi:predicted dienelactone hydrolase
MNRAVSGHAGLDLRSGTEGIVRPGSVEASTTGSYAVGIKERLYHDEARQRALATYIYYPTLSNEPPGLVGGSPVFKGFEAIPDAAMPAKTFPLVIISHGSGGNNFNQAYLALALARRGMITVAANHPGSTTGDSIPDIGAQAWLQVEDISFLFDSVLGDDELSPKIDPNAVGVIGHSKGGYSALAVVGARLDLDKFVRLCAQTPGDPNCAFYLRGGVDFERFDRSKVEANYRDDRFKIWLLRQRASPTSC